MTALVKLLSFYHEYELEDARLAMDRVRANLLTSLHPEAVTWCDLVLDTLRSTQEARLDLIIHPEVRVNPAAEAEARLDAATRTLHRRLDQEAAYVDMSPDAPAAGELRTQGWPEGVRRITTMSYAEKAAMAERLVGLLSTEPNLALLGRLHVAGQVDLLRQAMADFSLALRAEAVPGRSVEAQRAVDDAMGLLVWAITGIFSAFRQDLPAEVADRAKVLQPWVELNAAMGKKFAAAVAERKKKACAETGKEAQPAGQGMAGEASTDAANTHTQAATGTDGR